MRLHDTPLPPPQHMLTPRKHICEQPSCAEHKGLSFSLLLPKPLRLGNRSLLLFSSGLPGLLLPAKAQTRRSSKDSCSRSLVPQREASGLGRSSTVGLN